MQKHSWLFILLFSGLLMSMTGDKAAYKIFDINGNFANYESLLNDAQKADVVFFGEMHDNPIDHWLELQLEKDLYALKRNNLILGAEMFEADRQDVLNEYLRGFASDNTLKEEGKLWTNYGTDYKPLVDFAKTNKIPFIATNIPRRYANLVYNKGMVYLDSINPEEKKFIAPLPIKYDGELKCYKDIAAAAQGHGGINLPQSQAIKDATMAYFITKNWTKGKTMLHLNGSYHTNNKEGIIWYLKQLKPDIKILCIASTEQSETSVLDSSALNSGDYIICTQDDMTKTH